jgi:HD-like signal output (HDOD) protein
MTQANEAAAMRPVDFITEPPRDVAGWVAAFQQREIPVLASTDEALTEYRANEDAVDAHMLADIMVGDPLMTIKLLRHVATLRRRSDSSEPETATEALVMLGITPFFRHFSALITVEDRLVGRTAALAGLRQVLARAERAARFAFGFAVHRGDHDTALLHEAALLHDMAEMLLWVHAPALAQALAQRLQAAPGLRSVDAQRELLNVELGELQQALMKTWRLPALLVQISTDHVSPLAQVRNVQLAIRVARHSARGWDNPALADDIDEVADLLNMGLVPTLGLLHDLDDPDN